MTTKDYVFTINLTNVLSKIYDEIFITRNYPNVNKLLISKGYSLKV